MEHDLPIETTEEEEEESPEDGDMMEEIQDETQIDPKKEEKEAEEIIQDRYCGKLPEVGVGLKNYLKTIELIEQKVVNGDYEYLFEMKKKYNKYMKHYRILIEKSKTIQEEKIKQQCIERANLILERAKKYKL